jgi:hypothetical protein
VLGVGVGFGIPGAVGALHLARNGEVCKLLGFPLRQRPLRALGLPISVTLIAGFVLVCAAGWRSAC